MTNRRRDDRGAKGRKELTERVPAKENYAVKTCRDPRRDALLGLLKPPAENRTRLSGASEQRRRRQQHPTVTPPEKQGEETGSGQKKQQPFGLFQWVKIERDDNRKTCRPLKVTARFVND